MTLPNFQLESFLTSTHNKYFLYDAGVIPIYLPTYIKSSSLMDPIFKEDIRVRLPAVSNNLSGVKSDVKALRPDHGQSQASSIHHSLPIDATSLAPLSPLPSAPSAPTKSLPSLPTPEQRKRLLYRNIRAIPPQFQHHHKIGFIKKDVRPEKGIKVQPHTPPPPLSKSSPLIVRSLVRRSLLTD